MLSAVAKQMRDRALTRDRSFMAPLQVVWVNWATAEVNGGEARPVLIPDHTACSSNAMMGIVVNFWKLVRKWHMTRHGTKITKGGLKRVSLNFDAMFTASDGHTLE